MTPAELSAASLALTLALEPPLAARILAQADVRDVLGAVIAANLVSHAVATLWISVGGGSWLSAELGVIGFEALALQFLLALRARDAVLVSLATNVLTAGLALSTGPA